MKYSEVLANIIFLTKRNDITQTEIGEVIGLTRAAANKRAKRNSGFSTEEIEKLEKVFNISFDDVEIRKKEKEQILTPNVNMGIQYDFEQWGKRLLMLQVSSKMLDSKDFAKFLDIPEKDLNDYIMKNKYPKGEHLLKIKTRFSKTNIDWLLFGIST